MTVEADGSLVAELERRLRVTEPVIKFITVRMDEEEKRINKIKKLRSTKIKQSTVNAQAAQTNAAVSASQAAVAHAPAAQPVAPQRSVEEPAETAQVPEAIA